MAQPCEEIGEITQRNQDVPGLLEHLTADVHVLLGLVTSHDELLKEFGPMIEAWRRTNGGTMGLVRARKAARGGR
jgi:hypothetical protein